MSSLHQFTISKFHVNRWHFAVFPSTTDRLRSPAAPAKRTRMPPRSKGRNEWPCSMNATAGRQGFSVPKISKCPKKKTWEDVGNSEKSEHLWLKPATSPKTSVTSRFSASERPKCLGSGWHVPRGWTRQSRNRIQRLQPSCWRRELVRSNHDMLIKTQDP